MKLDVLYNPILSYPSTDIISKCYELLEEEWQLWDHRQRNFKLHSNTYSFPIRWSEEVDGKINVELHNQNHTITNSISPLINLLEEYYNGKAILTVITKMPPMSSIPLHRDTSKRLVLPHRCYLSLEPLPLIKVSVEGVGVPITKNTVVEISNTNMHSIINESNFYRAYLIIDILPSELYGELGATTYIS